MKYLCSGDSHTEYKQGEGRSWETGDTEDTGDTRNGKR